MRAWTSQVGRIVLLIAVALAATRAASAHDRACEQPRVEAVFGFERGPAEGVAVSRHGE